MLTINTCPCEDIMSYRYASLFKADAVRVGSPVLNHITMLHMVVVRQRRPDPERLLGSVEGEVGQGWRAHHN